MDKLLDCELEASEFKLQLRYYIQFWTNTLWKYVNTLIRIRK